MINEVATRDTWVIVHSRTIESRGLEFSVDTCPFSVSEDAKHFVGGNSSRPRLCAWVISYIRTSDEFSIIRTEWTFEKTQKVKRWAVTEVEGLADLNR